MLQTNRFIAIEGLDGSGKSTQISLLIKYLEGIGVQTKFVHFPRTSEGIYGALISKFLRGEFGEVKNVHPQLVALLFAQDRKEFATVINDWLSDGFFVLVDRYVLSNIAFQCAKLTTDEERIELTNWINTFEYDHNHIPRPDLSIYLDVPFSFTIRSLNENRMGEQRTYLEGKEDIHEKDTALQLSVKQEYDRLLLTDSSITRIKCFDKDNNMRSINDIQNEIRVIIA